MTRSILMVLLLEWQCTLEMTGSWITATFRSGSETVELSCGWSSEYCTWLSTLCGGGRGPRWEYTQIPWQWPMVYLLRDLRRERHWRLEIRRSGVQACNYTNGSRHKVNIFIITHWFPWEVCTMDETLKNRVDKMIRTIHITQPLPFTTLELEL